MRGSPADRLRVATYNIRYANLDTGPRAWAERRDGVAAAIALHRPDLIAVQECWLDQLPDLRERLPEYAWVAHVAGNGEHTPIGFRSSRLDLLDEGQVGLSPSGDVGSVGWDAALARFCTWARFRDRRTGTEFDCQNVHFDHEGQVARRESARQVRDRTDNGPTLVLGDLNAPPASGPYRLLARDLDDARRAAAQRFGPGGTFVGFGGEGFDEAGPRDDQPRLDYVFVSGFAVDRYAVSTLADATGRYPSDHLPVVVDLSVAAE
ncbi:endonuclease/exonuclease/phosphatase family protein [Halorarius litoreus]|uniref:endonuclease/exonuclease/phosphatase family protein n=1 Tax=Halorarius litoreus TaxID=2962676 RepID=UPI0020CDF132|nr:endonuclease/exonuclease/phosphatase family protein [Halorarius litoreus]